MYKLLITNYRKKGVSANTTKIGDVMRVISTRSYDSSAFTDHLVLHTYNGFVSLSNPNLVWGPDCSLLVEVLPKGTTVTFEVL
jgi:hypothetical protein